VRRAKALQETEDAKPVKVGLNPQDLDGLGLSDGSAVILRHDLFTIHTQAFADARVAPGGAYFPAGNVDGPSAAYGAEIRLEREIAR